MQNLKQVRAAVKVAPTAAVRSRKAVAHQALILINRVGITRKGAPTNEHLIQAAHRAHRHHHRPVIRNETNDIAKWINGNQ